MSYYVNNDELKTLLQDIQWKDFFNKEKWYDKYLQKYNKLYERNKIELDDLNRRKNFIQKRIDKRKENEQLYTNMDEKGKAKYRADIEKTKETFFLYVKKIVLGISNTKGWHKMVVDRDDFNGLIMDTVISVNEYSSRFDTELDTSCFCYLTQVAINYMKNNLNNYMKHKETFLPIKEEFFGELDEQYND